MSRPGRRKTKRSKLSTMLKMLKESGLMSGPELVGRDGLRNEVIEPIKNGASNGTRRFSNRTKRRKPAVTRVN